MITSVKIQGFKSIAHLELDLGRVNCLIGANGAGKSNILEAIGILGAAANGNIDDEAITRRGVRAGVPGLYKSSFETGRVPAHIGLGAEGPDGEEYRISLLNPLDDSGAWRYKTEVLKDSTSEVVSEGVRNKKNLTPTAGFAALKLVDVSPDRPAAQLMRRLQNYAIYSPNTPYLRGQENDRQMREPVGLSGGGLAEAFADLRKRVLDKDHDLLDSVFDLIDWISDIEVTKSAKALMSNSVPRGPEVLKFTDRYMANRRNALTAYDASEGALYVLFAAIVCLSTRAPKFFAIDNLDQALNPRLVTRLTTNLCQWMTRHAQDRQMLFTAHNPAVLDGLDLSNDQIRLFAVERNSQGHTRAERVTYSEEIRALNKEYPLSRLWLMGHLGAIPNV